MSIQAVDAGGKGALLDFRDKMLLPCVFDHVDHAEDFLSWIEHDCVGISVGSLRYMTRPQLQQWADDYYLAFHKERKRG